MHAHATHTVRAAPRVDLQLELTLIDALRPSPQLIRSAVTPTLRRLLARARIARVQELLGKPAPAAQLPLPATAAIAAQVRKAALMEATLLPLVRRSPTSHPELHTRLRLATGLAAVDLSVRGGWRSLERLAATAPGPMQAAWNAALWDVLEIEAGAWRDQAAALLPEQTLDGLRHAQRHHLWAQAHCQQHPAAPRLWMWMTLLATIDDRRARSQPRAPIPFA